MPTTDRTTIKATVSELVDKLRANLVAEPPTSVAPFRSICVGAAEGTEYTRPFLSLALKRVRPISVSDNDRLFEATLTMSLFVDATESDVHPEMLDAIGALEDYLDSIIDTGVIEGAEGFDDRVWTFDYPKSTSGARLALVSATQTFVVKVERDNNREPAA